MRRNDPETSPVDSLAPLPADPRRIIEILTPLVTPQRRARIDEVVAQRTLEVAVVLDDITDPHNVSAVLRSADAFGVQNIHVLPNPRHGFRAAPAISRGAHRWLSIHHHADIPSCCARLQRDAYALYVASMEGDLNPAELRATGRRVAVVFGNEHRGPSEAFRARAEGSFAIPMRGFAESLNVSVAAAITLYALTDQRPTGLTEAERLELTARFLMSTVHNAERVVRECENT